jgi:menaquinone-9 beta-reductase
MDHEVVVVGGGIAGCALAATLARRGVSVLVLERRERYDDRVRGESLWPWGVAEAMLLGLHETLLEAGGGRHVAELVDYGDGDDRAAAEAEPVPLSLLVEGAPGALNVAHPAACQALAGAASSAGAEILFGVSSLEITPAPRPRVRFSHRGVRREARCRLVVGADGRSSQVRHQAAIPLERAAETHLIAGLLVEGLEIDPGRDLAGNAEDLFMVLLPQSGDRARVYLCAGLETPRRFAGRGGAQRFLQAASEMGFPGTEAWRRAAPAGPCRTFPADDTWAPRPFARGVALVGDAAGHNNPLLGQGLALALRDVRDLAELLLENREWGETTLAPYGARRCERLRRMRFLAQLLATELTTFGPEGRALRRGIRRRLVEDPTLQAAPLAMFTGPEALEPEICTDAFRNRYLGLPCGVAAQG